MKRWLWPVNMAVSGLLVVLLVSAPVVSYKLGSASCDDEMPCDPHGYVMIFSFLATFVIAAFTLTAFGLTVARLKAGLVMGVVNSALTLWIVLALIGDARIWLLVPVGVLALVSLGFCIAGLVAAPPRQERIVTAPWPQHAES